MAKRKICTVLVNRANYGRVKAVLQAIKSHPDLELLVVVGSSMLLPRFGEAVNIVEKDGFTVHARVNFVVEGQTPVTMATSTGLGIVELTTIFDNMNPDAVLVVADRYDAMCAAISASYMNIPLIHLQGGEVTGSVDESVRHAITRLAHLHFPATELSAERLVAMGEPPETVHWVGCPAMDLIREALSHRDGLEGIVNRGYDEPFDFKSPYLMVLQHPVTTEYEQAGVQIAETLHAVQELALPAIFLMPNVDAGGGEIEREISAFREKTDPRTVRFYRNFSPENYVRLLAGAACIVGNSSSALREGAFLGTPAVNIGNRQGGREQGPNVVNAAYDRREIVDAVRRQLANGRYPGETIYGDGYASRKIADILATVEFRLQKRLTI